MIKTASRTDEKFIITLVLLVEILRFSIIPPVSDEYPLLGYIALCNLNSHLKTNITKTH